MDIGTTVDAMLSGTMAEDDAVRAFEKLAGHTPTPVELADAARVLRSRMTAVELDGEPIDTCGTGGSGKRRINTSTIAAFVVAAAGGRVAKHGNRAAGGRCGSFDLLEGLGARIDLSPDQAQAVFRECGLVFLFAPNFHPAMKAVAPARKRYGKPTVFNLLGPLCNPAGVKRRLLGTSKRANAKLLMETLRELGDERSLVVCGCDGLDEVTVCGPTAVFDVQAGTQREFNPRDMGLEEHSAESLEGGDVAANAAIARRVLAGEGTRAQRDLVLANAAHALLAAGVASLRVAAESAKKALDSGQAQALLERYTRFTRSLP